MTSNAAVNPLITPGGLTLYLLNATSLAKHCAIQQLGVDIMQLQPHVVFITETWFNSKHSNDCVSVTSYELYGKDRTGRKGGGVCVYVRDDIACTMIPCQSSSDIDILWLHLLYEQISYCIACVYHLPRPRYQTQALTDPIATGLS